jgi:hypothetical protein
VRGSALEQTVTASTMITDLNSGGKVRCHMSGVEKSRLSPTLEIGECPVFPDSCQARFEYSESESTSFTHEESEIAYRALQGSGC